MEKFLKRLFVATTLFLIVYNSAHVWSQDNSGETLTAEEHVILDNINDARLDDNVVLLVPNTILNRIARMYVDDLTSRQLNNLGNVFMLREQASDGQVVDVNLDTLLERLGYQRYSDEYVVDFFPVILKGIGPDQFVNHVLEDAKREADRTIISRRMSLGQDETLPLRKAIYREVGIAHAYDARTDRHYYAVVTGSQPQVLPIMVTQKDALSVITDTVETREVYVRIHNEYARPFGDPINGKRMIGTVVNMRISETPPVDDNCPSPTATDPGWQAYKNRVEFDLSAGDGLKTIYVQLCDNQGTSVTSTTQVTYNETLPTEMATALRIANMTQTAVIELRQYGTYEPTVEAILTATAAASAPTSTPSP